MNELLSNDQDASDRNALILLFAMIAVAGLPTLLFGLHADDWFQIRPRNFQTVLASFAGDWGDGEQGSGGFYRPLVRLVFSIEYLLFGLLATGYHLTNLLIFAGSGAAAYAISRKLAPSLPPIMIAGFLVVLFALNPVKNEALFWVSGRTDLQAALFLTWALFFALRALETGRPLFTGMSMGLFSAALLTKEIAVAGCLILPLCTLLLRPVNANRRTVIWLSAGPLLLTIIYLVFRSAVLGGLAGYRGEPTPLSLFGMRGVRSLSALFWPWQSDGPVALNGWLALPGLFLLGSAPLIIGFPRGVLAMAAAALIALLPSVAFVDISPLDGFRNLFLPMIFFNLAVIACADRLQLLRWPFFAGGVILGLSFLWDHSSMTREFLEARTPNRQILADLWDKVDGAESGTLLVIGEPETGISRRILTPGAAPMMAMQAFWMAKPSAESDSVVDVDRPQFALRLNDPSRQIMISHTVQPWMENCQLAEFSSEEPVRWIELTRVEEELIQSFPEDSDVISKDRTLGQIDVFAAIVSEPAFPVLRSLQKEQEVHRETGFYFFEAGPGITWMDTLQFPPAGDEEILEFHPGGDELSVGLRKITHAEFIKDLPGSLPDR